MGIWRSAEAVLFGPEDEPPLSADEIADLEYAAALRQGDLLSSSSRQWITVARDRNEGDQGSDFARDRLERRAATNWASAPDEPSPDDRLGLSLKVAWTKVDGGYLGALIGSRSSRWEWECRHEPHLTRDEAIECARAEVRARRSSLPR